MYTKHIYIYKHRYPHAYLYSFTHTHIHTYTRYICVYIHMEREREEREGGTEGDRKEMNIDIIVRNFYKSSFHKSVSSGMCTHVCVH